MLLVFPLSLINAVVCGKSESISEITSIVSHNSIVYICVCHDYYEIEIDLIYPCQVFVNFALRGFIFFFFLFSFFSSIRYYLRRFERITDSGQLPNYNPNCWECNISGHEIFFKLSCVYTSIDQGCCMTFTSVLGVYIVRQALSSVYSYSFVNIFKNRIY